MLLPAQGRGYRKGGEVSAVWSNHFLRLHFSYILSTGISTEAESNTAPSSYPHGFSCNGNAPSSMCKLRLCAASCWTALENLSGLILFWWISSFHLGFFCVAVQIVAPEEEWRSKWLRVRGRRGCLFDWIWIAFSSLNRYMELHY